MKKKFLLFFLVFIFSKTEWAQIAYNFTAISGTFTANSAPTVIHGAGIDDAMSGNINIGFTFSHACTNYTQCRVSSNGMLLLGTTSVGSYNTNNLNTVTERPVIGPLWDDLATDATTGSVNYQLTGASPNRVLTIEWLNMRWDYFSGSSTISFQAKLYETTNQIQFVYRQEAGAVNPDGASIGINGPTSGDFYSLSNTSASPTVSQTTETSILTTKPATGQIYQWDPINCSGTPAGGTADASPLSGCTGSADTMLVTGGTIGCGLTYQWESAATTAGPWTAVAGATNYTYISTITANICYRRVTTCTNSGVTAISTPVCVTLTGCYNMSNVAVALPCPSSSSFYDSQGPLTNYLNSENFTKTFTSPAGTCLSVVFNKVRIENGFDFLYMYDGPTIASTLVGTYTGNATPATFVTSSNSVTFRFTSNANTRKFGWDILLNCASTCSAAPAGGAAQASVTSTCASSTNTVLSLTGNTSGCSISYQWQSGPSATGPWTNIGGATANTYTAAVAADTYYQCNVTCAGFGTAASTPIFVDVNSNTGAGTGSVLVASLPYSNFNQTTCGMANDITSANVANVCGSANYYGGQDAVYVFTPTASGTITITMSNTSGTVGFMLYQGCPFTGSCVGNAQSSNSSNTICVAVTSGVTYYLVIDSWPAPNCFTYDINISAPAGAASGINCASATAITSLPFTQTGLTTCCKTNDYTSANACGSLYMNGEDYVFSYTPAANQIVDITISNTLAYTGLFVTQGCPTAGICTASNTNANGNPFLCGVSLTGGVTYYIIVDTWPTPNCTPFDIDMRVNGAAATCGLNYTAGTTTFNSPADAYGGTAITFTDDHFSNYVPIPFTFCFDGIQYAQFLVSSNGYLIFDKVACVTNLPAGANAAPGGYSGWSISGAIPNTTNAPRNAILGPWHDVDPGVSGSIFYNTYGVAPNRRFVISFNNVAMYSAGCNSQLFKGQIKLFETSYNVEVHLQNKTVCGAWNGGQAIMGLHNYNGTVAVVPAGGYNAPTQWTATNQAWRFTNNCATCILILPLELLSFTGDVLPASNLLNWKIANAAPKKFVVERSKDGELFETIGEIIVNDPNSKDFSYDDDEPFNGINYYKLSVIKDDGSLESSKIIVLFRSDKPFENFNIFPNPSDGNSTMVNFTTVAEDEFNINVYDIVGKLITSKKVKLKAKENFTVDINQETKLSRGTYLVELSGSKMKETKRLVIN